MTDMEKVKIHGVPETMMQTLFARAAHSQKKEHKFYDAKAIEIVKQLDYDFSKAEKDAAMSSGVIARTILLDQMVGAFLEEHPDATVVNIACGLDTRVYRLDNGQVRWYNLDLPEVIDIRQVQIVPANLSIIQPVDPCIQATGDINNSCIRMFL